MIEGFSLGTLGQVKAPESFIAPRYPTSWTWHHRLPKWVPHKLQALQTYREPGSSRFCVRLEQGPGAKYVVGEIMREESK